MDYPSPCDTCRQSKDCSHPCDKWKIRYRYRQKQINAYAKGVRVKSRHLPGNKFCYSHPDDVRRWLKESPCTGCHANAFCDTACPVYLRWYDARMQIARRKVYG